MARFFGGRPLISSGSESDPFLPASQLPDAYEFRTSFEGACREIDKWLNGSEPTDQEIKAMTEKFGDMVTDHQRHPNALERVRIAFVQRTMPILRILAMPNTLALRGGVSTELDSARPIVLSDLHNLLVLSTSRTRAGRVDATQQLDTLTSIGIQTEISLYMAYLHTYATDTCGKLPIKSFPWEDRGEAPHLYHNGRQSVQKGFDLRLVDIFNHEDSMKVEVKSSRQALRGAVQEKGPYAASIVIEVAQDIQEKLGLDMPVCRYIETANGYGPELNRRLEKVFLASQAYEALKSQR